MKKLTAFIVIIVMAWSLSNSSAASSDSESVDFMTNLIKWFHEINLDHSSLEGLLNADGKTYNGTFSREDGILDIDLKGICELQASERGLMFNSGNSAFFLDLSQLTQILPLKEEQQLQAKSDLAQLSNILIKAFREIIVPYVDLVDSYGGLSLHIETSDKKLWESLVAFVNNILDEKANTALLAKYLPILHDFIPEVPGTIAELQRVWDTAASRKMIIDNWSISIDVNLGFLRGKFDYISCIVQRFDLGSSVPDIYSFDFNMTDDGFSFLGTHSGRYFNQPETIKARLSNYALTASYEAGRSLYKLNASYDPNTHTYQIAYIPPLESARADITGIIESGQVTAAVTYYEDRINIEFTGDERNGHFSFWSRSPHSYNNTYDINFHYFRAGDLAYRCILNVVKTARWLQSGFSVNTCLGNDQFQITYRPYNSDCNDYITANLKRIPDTDEYDVAFEMRMPDLTRTISWFPLPYSIHIHGTEKMHHVLFSYPYNKFDILGDITVQTNGRNISRIDGALSAGYIYDPDHPRFTETFFCEPGLADFTGDYGAYRIEKVVETPDNIQWKYTHDGHETMITLALIKSADENELRIIQSTESEAINSLVIRIVEKIPIVPIGNENAITVDWKLIPAVIDLFRLPSEQ